MSFHHLKDSQKGKTCIVIGNGPSLRTVPREFFAKYSTFGCNLIYKLPYVPDYYTAIDTLGIENNWAGMEAIPAPVKFVREGSQLSGYPLHCVSRWEFSLQPNVWVWHQNCTFVMLQIAYYLGFSTILLVGVDHRFVFEGDPNKPRLIEKDINHFCEDYLSGQMVTYPKLNIAETAYRMAKQVYEADGRHIYNLTEGSALTIFPADTIDEWMTNDRH